jgi:REP element-mobilizing transposase RayT
MKNHPDRKPNRLKNYDYSQDGFYFVTICTQNREYFFGEIENTEMQSNEYRKITEKCWLEIPDHFPNVILDEFIIMPNHVHFIVIIANNNVNVGNANNNVNVGNANNNVNVGNANLRPLQQYDRSKMYLSKIIHGFKSSITREIRKQFNDYKFAWQRSFYDHIIRNEKSLFQIRKYIQNNPLKWKLEKDRDRDHLSNINF